MTPIDVRRIIGDYLKRRGKVDWQDALSQLKAEKSCSMDYHGRLLYELLQNAVDRAEEQIRVRFSPKEGRLYFANDGTAFSIWDRETEEHLSDFHALCSIHTSSKTAAGSIGNKGVGFKSVWEIADSVEIHSQPKDGEPWGFRLYHPLERARILECPDEIVRANLGPLANQLPGELPSFYFPESVNSSARVFGGFPQANTVVILEWSEESKNVAMERLMRDFADTRFFFLTEKDLNKSLRVDVEGAASGDCSLFTDPSMEGWDVFRAADFLTDWDTRSRKIAQEAGTMANTLGFTLDRVSLSLAFPPEGWDGFDAESGNVGRSASLEAAPWDRFYSYLPTAVRCGFSILIHGDFFLDNSRKNIDFQLPFNQALLEAAADLFVTILKRPEFLARHDLWRFLDPSKAAKPFVRAVERRMLDENSAELFHELLRGAFDSTGKRPVTYFERFFAAMKGWRERAISHYQRSVAKRRAAEDRLWNHLRTSRVACIPVEFVNRDSVEPTSGKTGAIVNRAVRLPDVDQQRKKLHGGNTVFFRSQTQLEEESDRLLSTGVFGSKGFEDVAVTEWADLDELADELKLTRFEREPVIRAIGSILRKADEAGQGDSVPHEQVFRMVWELLAHPRNISDKLRFDRSDSDQFPLRQFQDKSDAVGKALASIRVPVEGGGWQPAGKVYDPTAKELREVIADIVGFHALDIQRLESMSLFPEPDERYQPLLLTSLLGVWDCIPVMPTDAGFRPVVDLAALGTEDAINAIGILSRSWGRYRDLDKDDPSAFEQFLDHLRNEKWFPLHSSCNEEGTSREAPVLVWLVEPQFRQRLPYFRALPRHQWELSWEFLKDLWILRTEGEVVPAEKVLRQLRRMRDWYSNNENQLSSVEFSQVFKPRYRSMMSLLAREDSANMDSSQPPLLCEVGNAAGVPSVAWRDELPEDICVYFNADSTRRRRNRFPELTFAVLDPNTSRDFAVKQLGLTVFDVAETIQGDTAEDAATKERLERSLPYLLSFVDCVRIGGTPVAEDFTEYLDRWQRLQLQRGRDVYLEWRLSGSGESIEVGKEETGDVLLNLDDKQSVTILHDLEEERVRLDAFAEAIAEGVFRNPLYREYFSRILAFVDDMERAEKPDEVIERFHRYLESRGVDLDVVQEKEREVKTRMIPSEDLENLKAQVAVMVREITGAEPEAFDLFRLSVDMFRGARDRHLTASDINERLPTQLKESLGVRLECHHTNDVLLNSRKRDMRTDVLIGCLLYDETLRLDDGLDRIRKDYDDLRAEVGDLERIAFDPDEVIGEFLEKAGIPLDTTVDDWVQGTVQKDPRYPEMQMFLETGERFTSAKQPRTFGGSVAIVGTEGENGSEGIHPVAVKDVESRLREQKGKHARGLSAERYVAVEQAARMLPDLDRMWAIIQPELEHIARKAGKESAAFTARPSSVAELTDRLHVAKHFDGLGYDVLTFDEGALVRIEVKSSSAAENAQKVQFYLSDPERKRAREYLQKEANPSIRERWRLLLFLQKGTHKVPCDVTDQIRDVLLNYSPPAGAIQPVDYVIELKHESKA